MISRLVDIMLAATGVFSVRPEMIPAGVTPRTGVIFLHGIGRSNASMLLLQKACVQKGYATLNIDYPSRRYDIPTLARLLRPQVDEFMARYETCHLVGHSMGGLLIRAMFTHTEFRNSGAVITLGSPHHGSRVADVMCKIPIVRGWMGPALGDLREKDGFWQHLSPLWGSYHLSIAGNCSIDPICGFILKNEPHDGKVAVSSTMQSGVQHMTLPVSHVAMTLRSCVINAVVNKVEEFHMKNIDIPL